MTASPPFMQPRRTGFALTRGPAQRGFSLVMTLILLIVVTVIGVAASQMVLMSERGTRFDRDYQIAYQGAMAALRDAEIDIAGPNSSASQRVADFSSTRGTAAVPWPNACGTSGSSWGKCPTVDKATGNKDIWYTVDFTDTSGPAVPFGQFTGRKFTEPGSTGTLGVRPELTPRYIIERLDDTLDPGKTALSDQDPGAVKVVYRVTAVGFGPRKETQVVLQMIYRKG